jgi:hypothetical protein
VQSGSDIEVIDAERDRWIVALHGEHDIATAGQWPTGSARCSRRAHRS